MKTEEFDDVIKRKLESINPTFSEKDVDRVHKYSVINRSPFALLGSSRTFWTLMATGMLITGLVTWKLTSMFVHEQNPVPFVQSQAVAPYEQKTKPTQIVTKTDTVYITKYKYINKYPDSYPLSQNSITKNRSNTGKQYAQLPVSENNITTKQLPKNETITEINEKTGTAVETSTNTKSPGAAEEKQSNNSNNITETLVTNAPQNSKNTLEVKKSDTASVTEKTEKKEPLKKEIIKKQPVHNYADEHKIAAEDKPVNVNFMIGAGGETTLGNSQSGAGIFGKLLLNDRFSVNVGLKLMSVNHQFYATDEDFEKKNGYDFKWIYAPDLMWQQNCEVKNINFTYSLLQLPLALEYDLPVGHNFSLSASIGTNIDLSCTNSLSYDYSEGYTGYINSTKSKSYPTIVFNDLVSSVGLIYQIRHFDIQFSPFINKLNEKVWYEGKNQAFYGANLKVFYSF